MAQEGDTVTKGLVDVGVVVARAEIALTRGMRGQCGREGILCAKRRDKQASGS